MKPAMDTCLLCLESGQPADGCIPLDPRIGGVLAKHFWQMTADSHQAICSPCWEIVSDFHQLYERVAKVHKRFVDTVEEEQCEFLKLEAEVDPLPQETELVAEPDDNELFDTVEVFDLVPKFEVIEEDEEFLEAPAKSLRKCRQRGNAKKPSKTETTENREPPGDESEPEMPMELLVADVASEEADLLGGCVAVEEPKPKRRRGRPRKHAIVTEEEVAEQSKEELPEKVEEVTQEEDRNGEALALLSVVEICESERNEEAAANSASGTEDSEPSSDETDSDASWTPLNKPAQYAEIPKRVVVKPKKYRKRQKPTVPPKRLSRAEIDARNAQQAEYDKVIANFFGEIACFKCNLLVKNFGDMRLHLRAAHNEEHGYMMCCGRKFHQRKAMADHVYVHWNPEHFKCVTCGRLFQDGRALEVHEATHSEGGQPAKPKKVFQCDKCPKTFASKGTMEYHVYTKHVPKTEFRFTCTECNKKLPTAKTLKDHMKYAHDPESAIICDKCGKQVRSFNYLKKHHEIEHSDQPRPKPVPVQCEICGTWLRHMSGLKQHMKTMHEEAGGEHRCPICNRASTNARALKRHIYHNHECERKHKCTMCEKAFKRPQDLREHTSTHTGEVLYTCPNCPMTFFSNANMYKHRQRLHRAEWEADRKKPLPPNIMKQAVGATKALKKQLAVDASEAFKAEAATTTTAPAAPITSPNQTS